MILRDKDGDSLADCDNGVNDKLLWDTTTKQFDCGADQGGAGSPWSTGTGFIYVTDTNNDVGIGGTATTSSEFSFDSDLLLFTIASSSRGGDAVLKLGGGASWSFGVDDSDGDRLKIDFGSGLVGSDTRFSLFTSGASLSNNFEAIGYASASLFMGSAFSGNPDCNDATDKLLWSAGLFTCGTLSVADTGATGGTGITISTNDFSFNSTEVEATTWGAGGNASNVWTFNLTAGDPTMTWTGSGATLSLNFEAVGYASASKYFTTDLVAGALTRNQFGIDEGGFGQFVYRASGSEHVLTDEKKVVLSIASTSFATFASRSLGYQFRGVTIKRITCKVSTATSVQINLSSNGTTDMDTITCATTNTFDDGTIASATVTKGNDIILERRTISGEADFLTITYTYVETRE
jgi:hypothetical protein